ncbi:MAG: T9SS type A sorting domain-containing protein [Proteobacteria bacterium]|nr:MAG: T9SS type A sorting domain-containing protein [Pseudomonadota bacterium]
MKTLLRYGFLLLGICSFGQIPAGYYNNATGTGYALKTQLFNIIKNHTVKPYANLYTCYLTSDRDYFYENDGTVLDIYSEKPNGTDSYVFSATNANDRCGNYAVEGDCYNREHLMPQSVFDESLPMVSDPHHIVPTDGKVNGMRSNYPFGVVANPTWTSTNGCKLGNNSTPGYTAIVFEPIDEFKGDVARCLLYFATRYQNTIANYDHPMLNNTTDQAFSNWFLSILLQWHAQDPVSAREIARNNAIYAYQNNRNPFIDHPEYVCTIWSNACSLRNGEFDAIANAAVYPNPAVGNRFFVQSDVELETIEVYNVNGQRVRELRNPASNNGAVEISDMPAGFYLLKLSYKGQTAVKKVIVQ